MKRIKVIIADDHASFREGLARLLADEVDLEVIAQASDGEEAVTLATQLAPDVAVVDVAMPKLNGIEVTRQIKANCPSTAILIVSAYGYDPYVLHAVEAGAAGYLPKKVRAREIANAIRALHDGETVFEYSATRRLFKRLASDKSRASAQEATQEMHERELEVLRLVAKGMSNKEIANALGISVRTVQNHLVSIFRKLDVGSRTEAVLHALKEGLLAPDDLP